MASDDIIKSGIDLDCLPEGRNWPYEIACCYRAIATKIGYHTTYTEQLVATVEWIETPPKDGSGGSMPAEVENVWVDSSCFTCMLPEDAPKPQHWLCIDDNVLVLDSRAIGAEDRFLIVGLDRKWNMGANDTPMAHCGFLFGGFHISTSKYDSPFWSESTDDNGITTCSPINPAADGWPKGTITGTNTGNVITYSKANGDIGVVREYQVPYWYPWEAFYLRSNNVGRTSYGSFRSNLFREEDGKYYEDLGEIRSEWYTGEPYWISYAKYRFEHIQQLVCPRSGVRTVVADFQANNPAPTVEPVHYTLPFEFGQYSATISNTAKQGGTYYLGDNPQLKSLNPYAYQFISTPYKDDPSDEVYAGATVTTEIYSGSIDIVANTEVHFTGEIENTPTDPPLDPAPSNHYSGRREWDLYWEFTDTVGSDGGGDGYFEIMMGDNMELTCDFRYDLTATRIANNITDYTVYNAGMGAEFSRYDRDTSFTDTEIWSVKEAYKVNGHEIGRHFSTGNYTGTGTATTVNSTTTGSTLNETCTRTTENFAVMGHDVKGQNFIVLKWSTSATHYQNASYGVTPVNNTGPITIYFSTHLVMAELGVTTQLESWSFTTTFDYIFWNNSFQAHNPSTYTNCVIPNTGAYQSGDPDRTWYSFTNYDVTETDSKTYTSMFRANATNTYGWSWAWLDMIIINGTYGSSAQQLEIMRSMCDKLATTSSSYTMGVGTNEFGLPQTYVEQTGTGPGTFQYDPEIILGRDGKQLKVSYYWEGTLKTRYYTANGSYSLEDIQEM